MNKIPVWRTISQTYGFAISRYFQNLGVVWLPVAIMIAIAYFVIIPATASLPAVMHEMFAHMGRGLSTPYTPPAEYTRAMNLAYSCDLLIYLLFAPIAVGVTKEALGLRTGPRFIYLAIGTRELLVLAGWLVIIALYYAALIAFMVVGGVIGGIAFGVYAAQHHLDKMALLTVLPYALLLVVVIMLASFYFLIRLGYLMVPIASAEARFSVFESWRLTRGNVWRILGIFLGTMLPVFLFQTIYFGAIYGPEFMKLMSSISTSTHDPGAVMDQWIKMSTQYSIYSTAIGFLFAPFLYGVIYGQSAFAYRALVPESHTA